LQGEDLRRIVKEDLISMITDAGLLDEFIAWLRNRLGGHIDPMKIDSVDIKHMVEFLREKNMLSGDPMPVDHDLGEELEEVERALRNIKERRTRKYKPT